MGCCYSEPDGSDRGFGFHQDTATVYHEIKPVVIPTYTNIIRNASVRLPPVVGEVMPSAPPASVGTGPKPSAPTAHLSVSPRPSTPSLPIIQDEKIPHKHDADLHSLLSPVKTETKSQPQQKKKKGGRWNPSKDIVDEIVRLFYPCPKPKMPKPKMPMPHQQNHYPL